MTTKLTIGVQKHWYSEKWFFIVYNGAGEVVFQSDPFFDDDVEADQAAYAWIARLGR